MLIFEGAQAGPTWDTILRKREGYRQAFAGFDPIKAARFTATRKRRLLKDSGIIRNRLKVDSTVTNAQVFWLCRENSVHSIATSGDSWAGSRS